MIDRIRTAAPPSRTLFIAVLALLAPPWVTAQTAPLPGQASALNLQLPVQAKDGSADTKRDPSREEAAQGNTRKTPQFVFSDPKENQLFAPEPDTGSLKSLRNLAAPPTCPTPRSMDRWSNSAKDYPYCPKSRMPSAIRRDLPTLHPEERWRTDRFHPQQGVP